MTPLIYAGLPPRAQKDFRTSTHAISMKIVIRTVANYFHLTYEQVIGKSRVSRIATARHIAWSLLRKEGYTFTDISKVCSVHHTSVMNGIRNIEDQKNINPLINRAYLSLDRKIQKQSAA